MSFYGRRTLLDPDHEFAVLLEDRVSCKKMKWLGGRLGDEQSIEGIGVVEGQGCHRKRMFRRDC